MKTVKLTIFLVLLTVAVLISGKYSYKWGKEEGRQAERERGLLRDESLQPEKGTAAVELINQSGGTRPIDPGSFGAADVWCYSPLDSVEIKWPMEICQKSDDIDHPYFRIREGANRFAPSTGGSCSFLIDSIKILKVRVYVHARFKDECGDTMECSLNDEGRTLIRGRSKDHGTWAWASAYRPFVLKKGRNLISLFGMEDGIEFDKILIVKYDRKQNRPLPKLFATYGFTLPPVHTSWQDKGLPVSRIQNVGVHVSPSHSIVIGEGHVNRLSAFLRLNGVDKAEGEIHIRSGRGTFSEKTQFELTPEKRDLFLEWELKLKPRYHYLVPVQAVVYVSGRKTAEFSYNFIKPLKWAFLGPFPDYEDKKLDLKLPPEDYLSTLHKTPKIDGYTWITVDDGSCYSDLGIVDLNKVFGFKNKPRLAGMKHTNPKICYAVTCLESRFNNPHSSIAYAGDDCLQVWQNGKKLLRVDANVPLEISRQIVGTKLIRGTNVFVFKVCQNESYWQLLFEPDSTFPMGNRDHFITLNETVAGLGIYPRMEAGAMVVLSLVPGGPADNQKTLFPGDRILGVQEGDGDWVNFSKISYRDAVDMVQGKEGTLINLKVQKHGASPDADPEIVTMTRGRLRGW